MWRWSPHQVIERQKHFVFSTYVEVILHNEQRLKDYVRILHVCGGDPTPNRLISRFSLYSPRMWRWSQAYKTVCKIANVFSTYVEVIPAYTVPRLRTLSILHVCGGDPTQTVNLLGHDWYSPRMWRWSWADSVGKNFKQVFSTYVEVIPMACVICLRNRCILHVCGGDPRTWNNRSNHFPYSPRMWRWS